MVEVERATFQQVKEAQLELIFDHIDILEEKQETISADTRRVYFDLLALSTLGKCNTYRFRMEYDGNIYDLGSLSVFARRLAYFTDTDDKAQDLILKGKQKRVPINYLWKSLRENLYSPFDEALTLALQSSAELLKTGSESYGFTPDGE
jgi:hypothetical protein